MTTQAPKRTRRRLWLSGLGIAIVAVLAITLLDGGSSSNTTTEPAASGPGRGPAVPTTEFAFFDGSIATLAHYSGEPLVINFWASWCPSCVAEMSAVFRPVQQRLGDQVSFVGFDLQDERSRALALVEETGVLFDLAEDPVGDLYIEFGGIGMPFTVFVSPDGEVLHAHNGPLTEGQLEGLITEHLLDA
ncbi:MAG: TlpA disulfide reductase family protein [Acidimicrobiia bacterium]